MISIFRNNTPLAIGLLLLLAIVPELNMQPAATLGNANDHTIVWQWLNTFSIWLRFNNSFTGALIRVLVSLTAALYINRVVVDYKLMEKPGYLPAMCFLLFQMLIPEQVTFERLLTNVILIVVLKLMIQVYKLEKPINSLLTASFLLSLISLIDSESVIYFLWLTVALLIMRPASFREWVMVTGGYLLPIYLLMAMLYLVDLLSLNLIFSFHEITFQMPNLSVLAWVRISLVLIAPWICFIISSNQISKLLIQGRKTFIISLLLSIVVVLILTSDLSNLSHNLHLILLPATLLAAPSFVNTRKKLLPNLFILLILVLSQLR